MELKQLRLMEHPLVAHKIRLLRRKETPHFEFQRLLGEISLFLAVSVTQTLPTEAVSVMTPLEETFGEKVATGITLVPILRAGLGMVPAFQQVIPFAQVGFIGIKRNEETLQAEPYFKNLPKNIHQHFVIVLDPMLATGGSLIHAVNEIRSHGVSALAVASIISAPEGIKAFTSAHPEVPVFTAALDRKLNEKGYILPGLGDAGDRIFGE